LLSLGDTTAPDTASIEGIQPGVRTPTIGPIRRATFGHNGRFEQCRHGPQSAPTLRLCSLLDTRQCRCNLSIHENQQQARNHWLVETTFTLVDLLNTVQLRVQPGKIRCLISAALDTHLSR
jgi:hypothetical protein